MAENEEPGHQEGGEPLPDLPEESGQLAGGEGPGVDDHGFSEIQRGAALDVDEDAIAEAANTSLNIEGFETGAGFDLEGGTDGGDGEVEIETMEIKAGSVKEGDFQQTRSPEPAELGSQDPMVAHDLGGSDRGNRGIAARVNRPIPDLTIPGDPDDVDDARSLSERTPGRRRPRARHRGLEALERRRKRKTGARWLLIAASTLLVVGGGGVAVAYFGVVDISGITPPERSGSAVPAPVDLPGPQPETPVMSHVVFVDTWREIQTPLAMADALRERMPHLLGFVTTLLMDGDRQFALMVGPAYSAADANDLKVPLAAAFELLNPNPENWSVRESRYSFFLGEYATLPEANRRVQELADLSVPAFVLQVTYTGEGRALRVYGGAFSDEVQAREMGRLLRNNDLSDVPLIERRGRLPD